ncbi:MAG: dehydrogenase [bacterium]|nr:dehydrogenase [bacterium]
MRGLVLVIFASACFVLGSVLGEELRLQDPRLSVVLFAQDPDIVTPIGMAIDAQDRVYVVESHTHHPPADYSGPASDRIKVFVDEDNDGRADRQWVFADGLQQAMNLAFSPTGDLYVVCAREVYRFRDFNADGIAEERERILQLSTTEGYAHNCLLGITFDRNGMLYVARGNTGSRYYALQGSDGSVVEGYGDGGSVFRAEPDGAQVQEFATGFWNPFDLKYSIDGELLLVDNDPDARGPNRLLKVVEGGDYGYKSLYGGSGNHPFQGWDGKLPGTLPYIAGTGEAPSGVIHLSRTSFPAEYANCVLATIWNENSLECFQLHRGPHGLTADKSLFISGPKDFRPVALEADSRGNLYVTDWVLVHYPNHGRGRIWRISCNDDVEDRLKPVAYFERRQDDGHTPDATAWAEEDWLEELKNADPMRRHQAILELSQTADESRLELYRRSDDPAVRLAWLLACQRRARSHGLWLPAAVLREAIGDPDDQLCLAGLLAAGESFRPELRPEIDLALRRPQVTPRIFAAWLAAAENLQTAYSDTVKKRAKDKSNQIKPASEVENLYAIVNNQQLNPAVRAMAVERLEPSVLLAEECFELLELAERSDPSLTVAIFRSLARTEVAEVRERLTGLCQRMAFDASQTEFLRCSAIDCLAHLKTAPPTFFGELLTDTPRPIALAAADAMRQNFEGAEAERILDLALSTTRSHTTIDETLHYARHGLNAERNPYVRSRPLTAEAWQLALAERGDPLRGRRVFESPRVGCDKCHSLDGLGTLLGPDLSHVSQSKSREQIIDSILNPSAEFPPQYQAWMVLTEDGQVHRGLQLDHKQGGAIELTSEDGHLVRFEAEDISDYRVSPNSLMPQGLEQTMSVGEFRDLVAFLVSRQ